MAESIEKKEIVPHLTSRSKTDNQYDNLAFGGTSDIMIPEPTESSFDISDLNSTENKQDNINFANQSLAVGQLEIVRDTNPVQMDINDGCNESGGEGVPFGNIPIKEQNSGTMNRENSETTDMPESYGNTRPLTTDSTSTDGQHMNMFDYSYQLLDKLISIVHELKPILVEINISSKDADDLLQNLEVPFSPHHNMPFQKPLETLADILHIASQMLNQSNQVHNGYLTAEEANQTTEQRISAPNEENADQLNEQLQTSIERFPIPIDTCFAALSSSLTQLLSQARNIVQRLDLATLKIVEQPQEFWRKRSINCLRKKWCPAIQGRSGIQRHYIGIEWSKFPSNILFIFVQLLSYDNEPHPSNVLVPSGTTVQLKESFAKKKKNDHRRPKLEDLVIKDKHGFDKKYKAILCPVTPKEYQKCTKNLKVIMFKLYKTSEEIDSSDDEETDRNEDNISIEDQLLKLCKLRICLCQQTDKGELEFVSNFVDTDFIEESKGNKCLSIDSSKVIPQHLCNCGNEIITVLLNTDSEKKGFEVCLNDEALEFHQIHGVQKKQISFNSTPNIVSGQNYLNVMISKESILETIKQNHNPYNGLDKNHLLIIHLPYVKRSQNPHNHPLNEIDQTHGH